MIQNEFKTKPQLSRCCLGVICIWLSCVAGVFAQPRGPVYANVRYEDDYSFLSNAENRSSDPFNRLKKIPVRGSAELTFGGHYRFRFERDENRRFGASTPSSQSFNLHRIYLFAEARVAQKFRLFGEFKYAAMAGNELPAPVTAEDEPDVQNLFAEIWARHNAQTKLGLRAGRQELLLGKQRVIGPSDWANNRRTFDGLRLIAHTRGWKIDGFVTHPVEFIPARMNKAFAEQTLAGVYAQRPRGSKSFSAYYVALKNKVPPPTVGVAATGRLLCHTIGAGFDGKFGNFDWTNEAAYQFGDFSGSKISAYMVAWEGGYTLAKFFLKPRVAAGFDLASGDKNPSDAKYQTYNQLFPTAHPFLGWADQTGRQNLRAFSLQLSAQPHRRVTLRLQGFKFVLAQNRDAFYNKAAVAVRRSITGAAGNDLGREIEAEAAINLGVHASVMLGFAQFRPGNFVKNTGVSETPRLYYVMAPIRF